jgi:hypothetical protein
MKVVTGTGELLSFNQGLAKNNTGYDFRHLFIGSEGTLGFIVELTMNLTSPPKGSHGDAARRRKHGGDYAGASGLSGKVAAHRV